MSANRTDGGHDLLHTHRSVDIVILLVGVRYSRVLTKVLKCLERA